jgi:hypothetical protein
MQFLGASRDGLVARRVDLDTISSSVNDQILDEESRSKWQESQHCNARFFIYKE